MRAGSGTAQISINVDVATLRNKHGNGTALTHFSLPPSTASPIIFKGARTPCTSVALCTRKSVAVHGSVVPLTVLTVRRRIC